MLKTRTKNIIIGFLIAITVIGMGAFTYLSDSYSPNEEAIASLVSTEALIVEEKEDYTAFIPQVESRDQGLIFYQGGKVEEEAYASLVRRIAEKGIPSYIVRMPFNLAVFDSDAANTVVEKEKEIKQWYLAGHSLGGAMAANYASDHHEYIEGLILLASYSSADLRGNNLEVLSIYGSNDEILDKEKYRENKVFLPKLKEIKIEGGNHAYFGSYGEQEGDGVAEISSSEQLLKTAKEIINFIKE